MIRLPKTLASRVRRLRPVLTLAAVLALPAALSGCYVAPAPGYYSPPPVYGGVYVAPRPYYYGRPYYGGWGWRRW